MILRWRSSGDLFQVNLPGGCDNSDAEICFVRSDFDAAGTVTRPRAPEARTSTFV